MEKICVAVRVRPPVSQEHTNGMHWKVEDNRISLHNPLVTAFNGVSFAFDHVFDHSCSNAMVYKLLTKDIICASVEGFNGTAFAYGQTSSGKTFTMNGSEKDPGIIHLAVKDIFEKIEMTADREFLVRVSYMEIYNEDINDLFAVQNQKLQIHESLDHGIFVAGLREEVVNSAEQVLKLLESGEANRHFGETNMNVRSSRSHTIFRMVIESKAKGTCPSSDCASSDAIRVSNLNLVDLAGSERIAKTGAGGVRLKEGKYINKSLMVLGNVINKLSDGVKQRGHIPYRDSKLTRILQPALGGNAKTSIICTVAPEEVHIEETKGTLQFASRAKRITNCAQVNEILTDAALLKRQKQEIEELRRKLEGSHSTVLEQEILKLRNDMLEYELERQKLAMELEGERKLHKEREECIKEQQMKIDKLTFRDANRNSSQVQDDKGSIKEDSNETESHSTCQEDAFSTPCFRAIPNAFVAKRSNYSRVPDFSPLPNTFSNVADEDEWLKLNKGYTVDLDSLQITPARKVQSFPLHDITPDKGSLNKSYKEEIQTLKRQLELATAERNELERNHIQQLQLNNQLMAEVSELQQESLLIQEIPQRLCESVANCKDTYKEVFSIMQNFIAEKKSPAAKLLSSIVEMGTSLFSTLETHFSMILDGGRRRCSTKDFLIQEEFQMLCERLHSTVSLLVSPKETNVEENPLRIPLYSNKNKGCCVEGESACWKENLSTELKMIKEKYHSLEKEYFINKHILQESKDTYKGLERKFYLLKEEKDSLLETVSDSSQKIAVLAELKEKAFKALNLELQRRREIEEEIKQFSLAFACRKKSLMSIHSECRQAIERLRGQCPLEPKSLG